jgi:hypothetical protein
LIVVERGVDVFIRLSPAEVAVIRIWADENIHGGHWGDGDFMVPEENIILQKINDARDGQVDLSPTEVKIVLAWSESSRGIHTMEEASVIKKIRTALGNWKS